MKIAMLFPGYASHFVGMAKELYDEHRVMQEYFEEASNCLNINFVKLCFASSDIELSKAEHAHSAIFLVSSAIHALLKEKNITPEFVAGYGVGQLSAIRAAEGISLPDGLYFLSKYAQFYQELLSTVPFEVRVISVNHLPVEQVQTICRQEGGQSIAVAAVLTPDQCLLSGQADHIEKMVELLKKEKAKIQEISVAFGLHSALMQSVVDQLYVYAQKVDFHTLSVPLCDTMDGKLITAGELVKKYTIEQIARTIYWDKIMKKIASIDVCIEIGPGNTLATIVHHWYPDKMVISINKTADIEAVQQYITQKTTDR